MQPSEISLFVIIIIFILDGFIYKYSSRKKECLKRKLDFYEEFSNISNEILRLNNRHNIKQTEVENIKSDLVFVYTIRLLANKNKRYGSKKEKEIFNNLITALDNKNGKEIDNSIKEFQDIIKQYSQKISKK